jgi:hypothetical protein
MDLLLVLVIDVLLPIPIVILNVVLCALDLLFPAGWEEQLDCVERACFMPGSDVPGDGTGQEPPGLGCVAAAGR